MSDEASVVYTVSFFNSFFRNFIKTAFSLVYGLFSLVNFSEFIVRLGLFVLEAHTVSVDVAFFFKLVLDIVGFTSNSLRMIQISPTLTDAHGFRCPSHGSIVGSYDTTSWLFFPFHHSICLPSILYKTRVHIHGQRISKELKAELPRVREACENILWWQSGAPIEILGEVTQRRVLTSYRNSPSAKAVDIRDRVERVMIISRCCRGTLLGTRMDH